jgi:hypothetical protein
MENRKNNLPKNTMSLNMICIGETFYSLELNLSPCVYYLYLNATDRPPLDSYSFGLILYDLVTGESEYIGGLSIKELEEASSKARAILTEKIPQ